MFCTFITIILSKAYRAYFYGLRQRISDFVREQGRQTLPSTEANIQGGGVA